jgi:hypothetical protein
MTLDNEDSRKFEAALEEAVLGCMGIGVHPSTMIEVMERKIAELKQMMAAPPT